MYCNFAINIENLRKLKYYMSFKKHQVFLLFMVSVVMNMKKIFKEEESTKILKILGLITNKEEYQKTYIQLCLQEI